MVKIYNYIHFIDTFRNGMVDAVAACQNDPVASVFAELTKQGRRLTINDAQEGHEAWFKKLND